MTTKKARKGRLRAFIYVRISEDKTGERAGVERQQADCRELAGHLSADVVDVFEDDNISAFSGKKRPRYLEMLEALEGGDIDIVIAWHPDRLHRTPLELEGYIALSEKHGFLTHTCRAGIWDLSTPSGRAVARTLCTWARFESEHKSDRIKRASDERALTGKFHGGARPFGFDPDGKTIRPEEAKIVLECAAAVAAGASVRSLCLDLNRRGVATSSGRARWETTGLRNVLVNPRYAGYRANNGEVITKAVDWEPVVPEEVWRACCAILDDPNRPKAKGRTPYWLGSGLYRCGICGQPKMRVSKAAGGPDAPRKYRCNFQRETTGGSSHVSVDALLVDEVVEETMVELLSRRDVLNRLRRSRATGEAQRLTAEIAELEERAEEAATDFAAKNITRKQLLIVSGEVEEEVTRLTKRLAVVGAASPFDGLDAATLRTTWYGTEDDRSDGLSRARRRAVITALCDITILPVRRRGKFDPERVDFDWKGGL